MEAGIALGSNLGDRLANLRAACASLQRRHRIVAKSSVYRTDPVDCAPGDPDFFNAVVVVESAGITPFSLLFETQQIEIGLGRPAEHGFHAPRPIDLDIIYCGGWQISSSSLTLPHPGLHLRRFVLEPLAEVRPGLVLPGRQKSIAQRLGSLESSEAPLHVVDREW